MKIDLFSNAYTSIDNNIDIHTYTSIDNDIDIDTSAS